MAVLLNYRPEDKRSIADAERTSTSSSTAKSVKSEDLKPMERSFIQAAPPTPKESSPSIASTSSSSSSQTSKSVESKDSSLCSDSVSFTTDIPPSTPTEKTESNIETNQSVMTVSVSALDKNDPVILPKEISTTEKVVTTQEKITEELTADIDSALAEVVSGLQMLEMQQLSDKRMSLPNVKQKASAKHTPDLVLDLPEGSNSSPSGEGSEPDSPTSTADTFAKSNQGTLKKASSMPRNMTVVDRFYGQSGQDVLLETSFMSQKPMLSTFHVKSQQARTKFVPETKTPEIMSTSLTSMSSSAVAVPPVTLPSSFSNISTANPPPIAEKPKLPPKNRPPLMKKPSIPDSHRKCSLPSSVTQNPEGSEPQ